MGLFLGGDHQILAALAFDVVGELGGFFKFQTLGGGANYLF